MFVWLKRLSQHKMCGRDGGHKGIGGVSQQSNTFCVVCGSASFSVFVIVVFPFTPM